MWSVQLLYTTHASNNPFNIFGIIAVVYADDTCFLCLEVITYRLQAAVNDDLLNIYA